MARWTWASVDPSLSLPALIALLNRRLRGLSVPDAAGQALVQATSDAARTSTVALLADPALMLRLTPGTWRVQAVATFDVSAAASGLQYATDFSGAGTVVSTLHRHLAAGAAAEVLAGRSTHVPATAVVGPATGLARVEIEQVLVVTGGGMWSLPWAQSVSSVAALTRRRGSTLEARLLA